MTERLLQQLHTLQTQLTERSERRKRTRRKYYVNKFKINDDMTDEEKAIVEERIRIRREKAKERYQKNKTTREAQKKRAKEYYHKQKEIKQQVAKVASELNSNDHKEA
jgi:hypothetical protein